MTLTNEIILMNTSNIYNAILLLILQTFEIATPSRSSHPFLPGLYTGRIFPARQIQFAELTHAGLIGFYG
jgi:hypothetical protein